MTNVVLIDISSIAHPLYHTTIDDPNPNAMSTALLDRVHALAHGQPNVGIACDSKRSVRKETDPTYKANRPKEDRAALYHQLGIAVDTLKREGFPVWSVDGYEADDVIASAAAIATATPDVLVQIVSADKDLLALVSDRVTLKSLKDGSTIDAAAVQAKFGVAPAQIPDLLCLWGDAADNIKGANRIGQVTAAKLLTTYGNLEGIYAAWIQTPEAFTPAIFESLKEFWPRVDDVLNLIHLHADLPIPFEEIAVERPVPLFETPADSGFAFDADPTGTPAPAATEAELAPYRAQIEASVEAAHAVPLLPEADPAPAPAAPARRRRIAPAAPTPVVLSGADPMTPPDLSGPPVSPPVTVVESTPKVTVEQMKAMQAEAAKVEPAPEQSHVHAKPTPAIEEQRRKAPTMEPQAVALVPQVIEADYSRQLEPRSMSEAITLAKYAMDSRLFGSYGSAQGVLMTIMAGREMGMATMHSLRAFNVIDGKPVLAADAIRALVMRSGLAKYFRCTERTAERATFVTKRGDDPEIALTYTIQEAQVAGVVRPGSGWMKNPADMLVARAGSKLARLVYADVIHGIYSGEEFD